MSNLILIGMRGVGKSTLAKAYSEKSGLSWIDTDHRVVELYLEKYREKKNAKEIFQKDELLFRKLEEEVIQGLVSVEKTVISLGGGSTLSKTNRLLLPKIGPLFCLFLGKKEMRERCEAIQFAPSDFDCWYQERLKSFQELSCIWLRAASPDLLEILESYGQR